MVGKKCLSVHHSMHQKLSIKLKAYRYYFISITIIITVEMEKTYLITFDILMDGVLDHSKFT